MAHSISYNTVTRIIETVMHGEINFTELKTVIAESATLSKEYSCCFWLTDYTDASVKLSTMDIYQLPNEIQKIVGPLQLNMADIKRAIVTAHRTEDHSFAEIVNANRGLQVRVFSDIQTARAWLMKFPQTETVLTPTEKDQP
jgi:hypothetical protein